MLVSPNGEVIAFTKHELTLLTSVMAADNGRGLAAVWLDGWRGKAWATDGKRAVMAKHRCPFPAVKYVPRPVAIPAATARQAAKSAGPRDLIVIDVGRPRVSIDVRSPIDRKKEIEAFEQIERQTRHKHGLTCSRHQGGPGTIDHVFPQHQRRGAKGAIVAVAPALLAPLATMGKLAVKGEHVWINVGRPDDPILFVVQPDPATVWRLIVCAYALSYDEHPDRFLAPEAPAPAAATEPAADLAPPAPPAATEPAKPPRGRGRGRRLAQVAAV